MAESVRSELWFIWYTCSGTYCYSNRVNESSICGKLQLSGCRLVSTSPDRPNIYYEVISRQDVETDINSIASQLEETTVEMPRMIIYCRSRNLCADFYQFFLHYLGETSYYPLGAPKLCINHVSC